MSRDTNLLEETVEALRVAGKTAADVLWVASGGNPAPVGSWADFASVANFKYDAGYGGNNISSHLVVVGDGWWLERGEYDGSEWWEYKTIPQKPTETQPLRREDLDEHF